jgi:hypothetical protein
MSRKETRVNRSTEEHQGLAALCRTLGIRRAAGYEWLDSLRQEGRAGIESRSRRPRLGPSRTASDVVAAVLDATDANPALGPERLCAYLRPSLLSATPTPMDVRRILRNRSRERAAA